MKESEINGYMWNMGETHMLWGGSEEGLVQNPFKKKSKSSEEFRIRKAKRRMNIKKRVDVRIH